MSQTIVTIDVGGTGANTAAGALISLGAAPAISFDQSNTAVVTANIANTQATVANTQANFARAQANAAFDAANTRVLRAGDTMTGNLIMSAATVNTATANITTIITGNTLSLSTGTASNANVTISANGTEYVRLTNVGNFGIGTTIPATTLDALGSFSLGTSARSGFTRNTTSGLYAYQTNTNGSFEIGVMVGGSAGPGGANANSRFGFYSDSTQIGTYNAIPLTFLTNGSERARIDSSGNVGIGTTNPDQPLAFADSLGVKIQFNGNNNNGYQIGLASSLSGGDAMMKFTAGETGAGEFGFYNTTNARLFIANGGNVGIGTTNPNVRLSVFGDVVAGTQGSTRITITGSGGTTAITEHFQAESNPRWAIGRDLFASGQAGIGFGDTSATIAAGGSAIGIPTTRTLAFATSNGTALVERMRIDSSGHVLPGANATYNLGSSTARWATVFTSDLDLSNGIGDWTIVEGEDDLFIYNNKRGKVYKFKLEEVNPADAVAKKGN